MREGKCEGNDRDVRRIVGGDRPAGKRRGSEKSEQAPLGGHNRKLLRLAHPEQVAARDLVRNEPFEQTAVSAKLPKSAGTTGPYVSTLEALLGCLSLTSTSRSGSA